MKAVHHREKEIWMKKNGNCIWVFINFFIEREIERERERGLPILLCKKTTIQKCDCQAFKFDLKNIKIYFSKKKLLLLQTFCLKILILPKLLIHPKNNENFVLFHIQIENYWYLIILVKFLSIWRTSCKLNSACTMYTL